MITSFTDIMNELHTVGFDGNIMLIYGSYVHYKQSGGITHSPNDVDIMATPSNKYAPGEYTVHLKCVNVPVNVNVMTVEQIVAEISRGEMKYYSAEWAISDYNSFTSLSTYIEWMKSLSDKPLHWHRSAVSSAADKAFNKGKKKLTVLDDYDKELGLKNLHHSVCFPLIAKIFILDSDAQTDEDYIQKAERTDNMHLRMASFWEDLNELYDSTEGSLEDKAKVVVQFAKKVYNSTMTEFRKDFPKE